MKQIIMQTFSLIVLCLINISVGCNPKADKNGKSNGNGYDNSNLIAYENYKRNRIETPNFEATIHEDNGQFGDFVDTEKPQKHWDVSCETNCPYTGYDSGSSVVGGSSNNGDLALPQGEIHIQPYNQGPGYIQYLPSSGYNTGAGDNGKLINYNKVTAYPSDSYSAAESYNGRPSGNTNNYYHVHYSGSNGAGEKDRFPNYDKVKPFTSGGYYKREPGSAGGLSLVDKIWYSITGQSGRYPSYNKGKAYISSNRYETESNVGGGKTGLYPNRYETESNVGGGKTGLYPNHYETESNIGGGKTGLYPNRYETESNVEGGKTGLYPNLYETESNIGGGKTGSYPSYYELNYHGGDNGRWSTYNKGKQYQSDDHYTRDGPNNNSLPELSAESSSKDSTNLNSGYQPAKKYKYTDLYHLFDELYKKFGGSKLQENPDGNKRPSVGGTVDSNKYDDLVGPVCPQCQSYQDTHPESKGVLRQIYDFGVG